ncbi:MAG TPA: DUF262 domain-containing protein [Polyangiaceae bacterium]|nr:DUF262 domain-containing protein [Polyangiaceae bacterium]
MERIKKRPEAFTFTVERLLELVKEGKIRVPEFQRPIRWQRKQVRELFDSIYRGFPIGSLLLSKQPDRQRELWFGELRVHGESTQDAYFVVDGQQRINALAAVLLHPEPRPRWGTYALWFDLDREEFAFSQKAVPPSHWLPLNVAADSFKLFDFLNEWPLRGQRKDLMQRAIELGKAIRECQVPAYVLEGASTDALRLAFRRINGAGLAWRESEVFDALNPEDEVRPVEDACDRLHRASGFGVIDGDVFLKCLKMVTGLRLRESERDADRVQSSSAVDDTYAAVSRAIELLGEDARVLHVAFLPYRLPLLVLPVFFHRHPRPHLRSRELLARWVWRGALSGLHASDSDATLDDLRVLIDDDEFRSAERLLGTVPRPAGVELPSAELRWHGGGAKTSACALALAALSPRDPGGGEPLDDDGVRALLTDEATGAPKALGEAFFDVAGGPRVSVARALLVKNKGWLDALPCASAEVLASHGIDAGAAEALQAGDFEAFAERRARTLNAHFERFFARLLGRGDDDRPPIAELIRRADEQLASP